MERLRGLGRYQIALLVCGAVMILVFSVLYPVTTARVGFLYQDTILTPAQEGGHDRLFRQAPGRGRALYRACGQVGGISVRG